MRTNETITLTPTADRPVALYAPKGGVDAVLWHTFAGALELFLADEWDNTYPYDSLAVSRVVQVGPGTYRVTARDNTYGAPAVAYLLECDDMAGAYVQYASDLA